MVFCFLQKKNLMRFFICLPVAVIVFFACQRKIQSKASVAAAGIPACIAQKIDSIQQQPVGNLPAKINEYNYKEHKVYLISANCCDFYNITVDSNCNYVCAPAGGFTGKGDRKCNDFSERAKFIRLVWKDKRGKK